VADFIKTITNSVRVFGPEQTEKWSSAAVGSFRMIWGTDYWAYGTGGLEQLFTKGITAGAVTLLGRSELNVGKWILNNFTPSSTIAFRGVLKGIANSQVVTTTIGLDASKGVTNTAAITTAVGKDISRFYDNSMSLSDLYSNNLSGSRTLSESLYSTTSVAVYLFRDNYYVTKGGITNAVSWPRASAFSRQTVTSTVWGAVASTSTVWV
jgi:hypothetical protein